MVIEGWHGGWGNFQMVNPDYLGSGEGDSLGWGFYFSENRQGGEFFAKYAESSKGNGFLHKVVINIKREELLDTDCDGDLYQRYLRNIARIGKMPAAIDLRTNGIAVIKAWETDNESHGYTYIALDTVKIETVECYAYIRRDNRWIRES